MVNIKKEKKLSITQRFGGPPVFLRSGHARLHDMPGAPPGRPGKAYGIAKANRPPKEPPKPQSVHTATVSQAIPQNQILLKL